VFIVVVLLVGNLGETVPGHILVAHNACLARDCDFLARRYFVKLVVIILAFALDALLRDC